MIRYRAPPWRRRLNLSMIATTLVTETLGLFAVLARAGGLIGRRYPQSLLEETQANAAGH